MAAQKQVDEVKSGTVAARTPFQELVLRMAGRAVMEADDSSWNLQEGTTNKILSAQNEAEMWAADESGPDGGRDLADVEMLVTEISVRFSRQANPDVKSKFIVPPGHDHSGKEMYILVRSMRLDTGEEFIWNTSAPGLVSKLFWLDLHDMLPKECVIRATDLGGGQAVLKLKPLPVRAVTVSPL